MLPLDHRFEHNGQSVAWRSIGEGRPIVLIHGFPWSSQAWRRVAPFIAAHHRVYYFDMLGTGLSEKFDGQDVSPAVQNDLLAALFDHWSLYPAKPLPPNSNHGPYTTPPSVIVVESAVFICTMLPL